MIRNVAIRSRLKLLGYPLREASQNAIVEMAMLTVDVGNNSFEIVLIFARRDDDLPFCNAQRWKIETFHKVLKSGCKSEDAKLRSAARLMNLIPKPRLVVPNAAGVQ